jgi:MPBQ/MSBQ methyltransferase
MLPRRYDDRHASGAAILNPRDPHGAQGSATAPTVPPTYERLIRYYEAAGPDFEEWSPAFNMHYGFYRKGLNPLRREPMLAEMNRQVLQRLNLLADDSEAIIDMGCGVGATVRYAAGMFPLKTILGVTIVPWQVETGNAWNRRIGLYPRARLELRDYTRTGLESGSFDGAVAIESACHAPGASKEPFIREAARILKPGARLVVADAYLKKPERRLDPLSQRLHDAMCRSFVLQQLGQIEAFAATLTHAGFDRIKIEDVSWRVAPSALHAPIAVFWFALRKKLRGERLGEHSVDNLRGSALSAILGVNRLKLGYYLITARRA